MMCSRTYVSQPVICNVQYNRLLFTMMEQVKLQNYLQHYTDVI